jgi:hypothetical protein
MKVNYALLLLTLLAVTACSQPDDKLKVLEEKITAAEERIEELDVRLLLAEAELQEGKEVPIDCTNPSYVRIESNNGTFLVVCEEAEPYLDGFRLNLLIGNPSTLRYHGVDLQLSWHRSRLARAFKPEEIKKVTRSISEPLIPGSWNRLSVVITPTRQEELGDLRMSIAARTVSLSEAP